MLPGCTTTASARFKGEPVFRAKFFFIFVDDCTVVHACKTTALQLEREAKHTSGLHHHRRGRGSVSLQFLLRRRFAALSLLWRGLPRGRPPHGICHPEEKKRKQGNINGGYVRFLFDNRSQNTA